MTKCLGSSAGVAGPVKRTPARTTAQMSSSKPKAQTEEADKELDLLLGLQKPVTELSISEPQTSSTAEEVYPVLRQSECKTKRFISEVRKLGCSP